MTNLLNHRQGLWISLAFFTVLVLGCGKGKDDDSTAGEGVAGNAIVSAQQTASESALLSELLSGMQQDATPEDLAAAAADAATSFQPSDCVTTQTNGTTVTWTFNGCQGGLGLAKINGSLTVTYQMRLKKVEAQISSTDLKVNSIPIIIKAQVVAETGANKSFKITTDSSAQVQNIGTLGRKGSYTVDLASSTECIVVDGEWTTTVGKTSWRTNAQSISVCSGGCIEGTVVFTGGGSTCTLVFSRDGEVSWSTNKGQRGTADLHCGE